MRKICGEPGCSFKTDNLLSDVAAAKEFDRHLENVHPVDQTDVLSVDENGYTALARAASAGQVKRCADLIANGKGINLSPTGQNPFEVAAHSRHEKVVKLLWDHGGDKAYLFYLKPALRSVVSYECFEDYSLTRFLISKGANIRSLKGKRPKNWCLILGAYHGDMELVKEALGTGQKCH